jgi:hypothetical protein
MAGGTVTIVGGNVIHTFTSTGYLTPLKYSTGSVRFRSSNSAYLTRTPTVTGSRTTWTYSAWVKVGTLGLQSELLNCYYSSDNKAAYFRWNSDNTLTYFDYNSSGGIFINQITTTQVLRDPAAWYHLVMVYDTSNATSSDRLRLYINGVRVTSFSTANYPSSSYAGTINTTSATTISKYSAGASGYFDGEMTEINFVDGQALTPNSFGTFNSYGVWQPITYGGSYGTNGFYLPFNRQAVSYVGSFSSNYLSATQPAAFGTGTFTVEGYFNATANTNYGNIFATKLQYDSATGGLRISVGVSGSNKLQVATYLSGLMDANVAFTLNTWNHFAYVRTSSVGYLYLNGKLVASATDATNYTTTQFVIGNLTGSGGPYYFSGQMSNIRAVTGVAVYTSNFVPPTSALTAISGTQLLTLQNSSIIDNSSYALSITNTGGVSTGQTYPFAYGIFNDQGPAGNNWTPSGVSGVTGTTLDYLGDAPTLTSTTVANTCTWNPIATPSGTLANGNLQITGGTARGAWGTLGVSSGKFYWEYTINSASTSNGPYFGFSNYDSSANQGTIYGLLRANNGQDASSGVTTSTAGSGNITSGVVGVALDMDAKTATIYAGNVVRLNVSAIPAGTYFPFFRADASGDQFVLNAGQQPFFYTPPTGYVALNTYNL